MRIPQKGRKKKEAFLINLCIRTLIVSIIKLIYIIFFFHFCFDRYIYRVKLGRRGCCGNGGSKGSSETLTAREVQGRRDAREDWRAHQGLCQPSQSYPTHESIPLVCYLVYFFLFFIFLTPTFILMQTRPAKSKRLNFFSNFIKIGLPIIADEKVIILVNRVSGTLTGSGWLPNYLLLHFEIVHACRIQKCYW